jgi:hypothetical protein
MEGIANVIEQRAQCQRLPCGFEFGMVYISKNQQ